MNINFIEGNCEVTGYNLGIRWTVGETDTMKGYVAPSSHNISKLYPCNSSRYFCDRYKKLDLKIDG
jgi:hypothetical protein